jgi:hypothetical protein
MPELLKLLTLDLKAGNHPLSASLQISPVPDVTVFVGPNNSGKSTCLKEIEQWAKGGDTTSFKVVRSLTFELPTTRDQVLDLLRPMESTDSAVAANGQVQFTWHQLSGRDLESVNINLVELDGVLAGGREQPIRSWVLRPLTVRLDGRGRFALVESKGGGNLNEGKPRHLLWALYRDDSSRKQVQEIVENAFGYYFLIDLSSWQFQMKFAATPPRSPDLEKSLSEEALAYFRTARSIDSFGDGVQAFTGLVSGLASLPHRLVLIDEPEAFLHPSLARKMGKHVVEIANARKGNVLVSTHSADFLMGCLENGERVSIVRLTYDGTNATAANLSAADLKTLMRDPLLRSVSALRALFHTSAVVAEADADRAFYGEINNRLQSDDKGLTDSLFLNAQNWQTIGRIVKPLRSIGVPAVSIMDLDVIDRDSEWPRLYDSHFVPTAARVALEVKRLTAVSHLTTVSGGRTIWKAGGIATITDLARRAEVQAVLEAFGEYGLNIVPSGELESWLPTLGAPRGDKKTWITTVFEKMKSDPTDTAYVKPATDDVWKFMSDISKWVIDPNRKGMR